MSMYARLTFISTKLEYKVSDMSLHLEEPDLGNLDLNDTGDEESEDDEDLDGRDDQGHQLPITETEVDENYTMMGTLSQPCISSFTLEQLRQLYPQAFSPHSAKALADVLLDLCLPYSLSPLQV